MSQVPFNKEIAAGACSNDPNGKIPLMVCFLIENRHGRVLAWHYGVPQSMALVSYAHYGNSDEAMDRAIESVKKNYGLRLYDFQEVEIPPLGENECRDCFSATPRHVIYVKCRLRPSFARCFGALTGDALRWNDWDALRPEASKVVDLATRRALKGYSPNI